MATPTKRRNFTFALVVDSTPNIEQVIKNVEQCPAYAYILHDKDSDTQPHYHFYIEFPNPRNFSSVAQDIEVPTNFLQKVIDKTGILTYLTHENEKNKYHYSREDIKTNLPPEVFENKEDRIKRFEERVELFESYARGELTKKQLILQLKYVLCDISDYQQVRILYDFYVRDENIRNGGTCPRSEFLVPP